MDRPLAGRSPLLRLARPLSVMLAPASAASRSRSRRPAPAPARSRPALRLPTHGARLAGGPRRAAASVAASAWEHRRVRMAIVGLLAALALIAGGWLLLRHSSFVSVQNVRISGVHGPQAAAIDGALVAAAHRMSTLDVKPAALRAAVSGYPVVREVRASASFPHGLRVRVVEQAPAAALQWGGQRTAVAADGVVLGPALLGGSLPTLAGYSLPLPGARLHDPGLLASLLVLGAAPEPLAVHVARVFSGPRGLTVAMANGLLVYFGDASRPHAKWFALARVLADPSSAGASYVDVRLPSRPAAGFPGGVAPALPATTGTQGAGGEGKSGSESTVGALAAGLAARGGAGTSPTTGTESASPTGTEAQSQAAPTESPTQTSSAPSQASPPASPQEAQNGTTPGG